MTELASSRAPRGTLVLSIGLWLALIAAFFAIINHGSKKGVVTNGTTAPSSFSHVYPPDPIPFERPPVGTSSPYVPSAYRLHTNQSAFTITALAALSTNQSLHKISPGVWRLDKPMELGVGSTIAGIKQQHKDQQQ